VLADVRLQPVIMLHSAQSIIVSTINFIDSILGVLDVLFFLCDVGVVLVDCSLCGVDSLLSLPLGAECFLSGPNRLLEALAGLRWHLSAIGSLDLSANFLTCEFDGVVVSLDGGAQSLLGVSLGLDEATFLVLQIKKLSLEALLVRNELLLFLNGLSGR